MYLIPLNLLRLESLKKMTKISEAGFKLAKWKTVTIPKKQKQKQKRYNTKKILPKLFGYFRSTVGSGIQFYSHL